MQHFFSLNLRLYLYFKVKDRNQFKYKLEDPSLTPEDSASDQMFVGLVSPSRYLSPVFYNFKLPVIF